MRLRFLLALCLSPFLLSTITARGPGADAVPSWFYRNPNDPHAIFSAWRNLSAREAALFLGNGRTVLGGQLRDQEGKPLALMPITIYYNAVIRSFSATRMTDRDGYFLIYSPYSLDVRGPVAESMIQGRFCLISAAPGYPPTESGLALCRVEKGGAGGGGCGRTVSACYVKERKRRSFAASSAYNTGARTSLIPPDWSKTYETKPLPPAYPSPLGSYCADSFRARVCRRRSSAAYSR